MPNTKSAVCWWPNKQHDKQKLKFERMVSFELRNLFPWIEKQSHQVEAELERNAKKKFVTEAGVESEITLLQGTQPSKMSTMCWVWTF